MNPIHSSKTHGNSRDPVSVSPLPETEKHRNTRKDLKLTKDLSFKPKTRPNSPLYGAVDSFGEEIEGVRADAMRFGLHGVKADILEVHPFQSAHQSAKKRTGETNRAMLRNTYGSAFPLKMELDRQILSRFVILILRFVEFLCCRELGFR
ncbi:hypothetical protein ACHQM5_011076 [Ranunculus cassubicifolius]